MLDSGGQGTVCLYKTLPHRDTAGFPELVAVKFDPNSETMNLKETLWLKDQTKLMEEKGNNIKIPKYITHSFYKSRRFFVMTYLPESIEDLLKSKGEDKRNMMIPEVAIKMLNAIEAFHKLGFLHRDIKPSNFRVMDGEVYVSDFGTVASYLEENGSHI
jgi:serine/threonine protein kinase